MFWQLLELSSISDSEKVSLAFALSEGVGFQEGGFQEGAVQPAHTQHRCSNMSTPKSTPGGVTKQEHA